MPEIISPNKVRFSTDEIRLFTYEFPCSGLQLRSYWFEFDSKGDLVDTDVPEHSDGAGSQALSELAREFLEKGSL